MASKLELKEEYIKYFADVPIQKYAAMFIGRDEDTIIRWRKDDPTFADAVQRAKAEWVRKKMLATKAEFALERLEKEVFAPVSRVDMTVETSAALTERNRQLHFNDPLARRVIEAHDQWLLEVTKAPQE